MEIIEWIDKQLKYVEKSPLFKKYFDGIEIIEDEGRNYLFNPKFGIDIVLSDDLKVQSIHFFSEQKRKNKEFNGSMPFNLNFSMNRSIVKQILGIPNKTGGGYTNMLGKIPFWDKYLFSGYGLHVLENPAVKTPLGQEEICLNRRGAKGSDVAFFPPL